ncbi:MAG TPA: RpiB/LacA/LacB family sugar-phosphate isomerase [Candidatus Deferrimicrobium sp.]|nr:RpiB/LacA/LacB family sugar-phosphate isomerase [Candidatus Deferrimicrobium sp.]
MAEPRTPDPDEIRALVRRIVEATLAGQPTSESATASTDGATSTPGASPGASGAPAASADPRVAVALGSDHGGWQLKDTIAKQLTEAGYAIHDCGTNGPAAVDYPDIALAVARLVADGTCRWGIVLDGAGIGSAMVANKVPGIRAANCHDLSSARNSREHNHANVLTLGARFLGEGLALEVVRVWLGTAWGPGRHAERVEKISQVERTYAAGAPRGGAA